jgi:hypothetical protein
MHNSCCSAALTILTTLLCVSTAGAQRPHLREAFWGGVGLGYGSADASCEQCFSFPRDGGGIASVKLGYTVSDRVLIAGDVLAWIGSRAGTTVVMANITLATSLYLERASGLFVKAGVGSSMYREPEHVGTDQVERGLSGAGPGIILGVGNDFRVGNNASLTAAVDFIYGWVGAVYDRSHSYAPIRTRQAQNLLSVTLGVTFH